MWAFIPSSRHRKPTIQCELHHHLWLRPGTPMACFSYCIGASASTKALENQRHAATDVGKAPTSKTKSYYPKREGYGWLENSNITSVRVWEEVCWNLASRARSGSEKVIVGNWKKVRELQNIRNPRWQTLQQFMHTLTWKNIFSVPRDIYIKTGVFSWSILFILFI